MATLKNLEKVVEREINNGTIDLAWKMDRFHALVGKLGKKIQVYRPDVDKKTRWGSGPNENGESLAAEAFFQYVGILGNWFPDDCPLEDRIFCVQNGISPEHIRLYQSTDPDIWDWAERIEGSRSFESPYHMEIEEALDLLKRNRKALEKTDASQLVPWRELSGIVPDRDLPLASFFCARCNIYTDDLVRYVRRASWTRVKTNLKKLVGLSKSNVRDDILDALVRTKPIFVQEHSVETAIDVLEEYKVVFGGYGPEVIEGITSTWPYHQGDIRRIFRQPCIIKVVQKRFEGSWKEACRITRRLTTVDEFCKRSLWENLYQGIELYVTCETPRSVVDWIYRNKEKRSMLKERPFYGPRGEHRTYRWLDRVDEVREDDLVNGPKTAPERVMTLVEERRQKELQAQYENVEFEIRKPPYKSDEKLELITCSDRLREEGHMMGNCVFGYVRNCIREECYIYHYGPKAPDGLTVEVNTDTFGKPYVQQALGYGNSQLPEVKRELEQHLKEKGKEVKNVEESQSYMVCHA